MPPNLSKTTVCRHLFFNRTGKKFFVFVWPGTFYKKFDFAVDMARNQNMGLVVIDGGQLGEDEKMRNDSKC